jgi:hypothetical protein
MRADIKSNFFKKKKNIILIHFQMKNTLKSNRNHTPKLGMVLFFLFLNFF